MPVNLLTPSADELYAIPGIELGIAQAGIKKAGRDDLLLIKLARDTQVAGVFTQNRFCAAPVQIARQHLDGFAPIRALVINTGNANAATGEQGLVHARTVCAAAAALIGCDANQVLPFSTGVIMEPLPVERIIAALPSCHAGLSAHAWLAAARAIMTTDTVPKAVSRKITLDGGDIKITGIAKGAGMICPNMATMLAFIATDAAIDKNLLQQTLREVAAQSFNRISIDGDSSTNDSFILLATGQTTLPPISKNTAAYQQFYDALMEVAQALAIAIVRDGEGATKLITIVVEQGKDIAECDRVARSIAHSPLVKTAFFASDPNLGRIICAVGNASVTGLDAHQVSLYLDELLVVERGGRASTYREEEGQRIMKQSEITVRICLGRGHAQAVLWTCDLSHDYVRINAEYRS